jgi:hypothetical protein
MREGEVIFGRNEEEEARAHACTHIDRETEREREKEEDLKCSKEVGEGLAVCVVEVHCEALRRYDLSHLLEHSVRRT